MTAAAVPRNLWRVWLMPLLSVAVLCAVLAMLHRTFAGYHLRDVFHQVRALPATALWLSIAFTVASYVVLTGYDLLALRYVGQKMSAWRGMLVSFVAFAVGHNIGMATLSGAAIRLRLYTSSGVAATDIALISVFCALTTVLGAFALLAYAFISQPAEAGEMLHLPGTAAITLGVVAAAMLLAYLIWTGRRRTPWTFKNWSLTLPKPSIGVGQTLVAALDLCFAAAALYVLLPDSASVSYETFLAAYVLAAVAALLSNVPGGLGVFETAMLLALPQWPAAELLAALLAYRAIYYLAPLALAAVFLAAHEAWLYRHRVIAVAGVARDWLSAVAPQVIGSAVIVAGVVLLLSGATPAMDNRLRVLVEIVPLPILELSHLLGSVAGLGLLILSHALFRRVQLAWELVLGLLLASAVFSLLKGLDYEEALLMLGVAGLLLLSKSAFYRRAALLENRFNAQWLVGLIVVVGVVVWVGMLAHRHVEYSQQLWWTFASSGNAPRMLRAAFIVSLLAAAFISFNGLSPHSPEPQPADAAALERAKPIVANAARATANLALLGDKRILLHPEGDGFLMFQVAGRSWVSMGDPVVSAAHKNRASDLAWEFRELADEHGGWTVFYQVTPEYLPLYIDIGLALLKLGEEARVPLNEFSLEGSRRAELRTARRKAQREGVTFEVVPSPADSPLLQELSAISQDWLDSKSASEKRFSVGFFDENYLRHFPLAVVRVQDKPVAFANLWTTAGRNELSIDLMRYSRAAPNNLMDFLLIETMLWGTDEGYQWFNLGMAPLSGLEQRPLAPIWHRLGNMVFDVGGQFYNFEGLRRYKEKFLPVWEPRYLAAPGGLALPRVLIDVMSLIAGGLREIVSK